MWWNGRREKKSEYKSNGWADLRGCLCFSFAIIVNQICSALDFPPTVLLFSAFQSSRFRLLIFHPSAVNVSISSHTKEANASQSNFHPLNEHSESFSKWCCRRRKWVWALKIYAKSYWKIYSEKRWHIMDELCCCWYFSRLLAFFFCAIPTLRCYNVWASLWLAADVAQ